MLCEIDPSLNFKPKSIYLYAGKIVCWIGPQSHFCASSICETTRHEDGDREKDVFQSCKMSLSVPLLTHLACTSVRVCVCGSVCDRKMRLVVLFSFFFLTDC